MQVQKVMLVSHDAHPQMISGAEKALLMFAAACRNLQFQVAWVSPNPGLSYERSVQMGMDSMVIPFPLLWILIHNPERLSEELNCLHQEANNSQLEQVIKDYAPDLIVSNSAINVLPGVIAHKKKIPLWWYIHEVIPDRGGTNCLLSQIHSYSDRILVPSEAVKNSLSQEDER